MQIVKSNKNLSKFLSISPWKITEPTSPDDVQLGMSQLLGHLCGHCYRKTYTDTPNSAVAWGGSKSADSNVPRAIAYLCGRGGCGIKIFHEPVSFPKHLCKLLTSKQLLAMRCLTLLYCVKITSSLFDLIPEQLHILLPSFNLCSSQQSYGREAGISHGVVTPHWCELLKHQLHPLVVREVLCVRL